MSQRYIIYANLYAKPQQSTKARKFQLPHSSADKNLSAIQQEKLGAFLTAFCKVHHIVAVSGLQTAKIQRLHYLIDL